MLTHIYGPESRRHRNRMIAMYQHKSMPAPRSEKVNIMQQDIRRNEIMKKIVTFCCMQPLH